MRSLNVFILSVFLMISVVSSSLAMGDAGFVENTLVGKPAADFTLKTVKDNTFNLTKYRAGKKAIIIFWTTWCPHCREALKEINAMRAEIVAKGIVLVFISVGEAKQSVENYLAGHHYDFDVVLDERQSLDRDYQISGVPTLFYVDEQGRIKSVAYNFTGSYLEYFK